MRFICAFLLIMFVSCARAATPPDAALPDARALAAAAAKDDAKALATLQSMAGKNDAAAQYQLGLLYDLGRGVKLDYAETLKWWRKAAAQGNAQAQVDLATLLSNGIVMAADYAEAAKWFRKAAEQNTLAAQFQLALLYEHGNGVKKDDREAAFWLMLAEHHGFAVSSILRDDITGGLSEKEKAALEKRVQKWKPLAASAATPAKTKSN